MSAPLKTSKCYSDFLLLFFFLLSLVSLARLLFHSSHEILGPQTAANRHRIAASRTLMKPIAISTYPISCIYFPIGSFQSAIRSVLENTNMWDDACFFFKCVGWMTTRLFISSLRTSHLTTLVLNGLIYYT